MSHICDCHISSNYIGYQGMVCEPDMPNTMIFQGIMVSMNDRNISNMMEDLAEWVSTAPHVVVEGQQLVADKDCSVQLPELEDANCMKATDVKETSQFPVVPITAGVGILVLATLILLTLFAIIVQCKRSK